LRHTPAPRLLASGLVRSVLLGGRRRRGCFQIRRHRQHRFPCTSRRDSARPTAVPTLQGQTSSLSLGICSHARKPFSLRRRPVGKTALRTTTLPSGTSAGLAGVALRYRWARSSTTASSSAFMAHALVERFALLAASLPWRGSVPGRRASSPAPSHAKRDGRSRRAPVAGCRWLRLKAKAPRSTRRPFSSCAGSRRRSRKRPRRRSLRRKRDDAGPSAQASPDSNSSVAMLK
jgi:hypothetical protein